MTWLTFGILMIWLGGLLALALLSLKMPMLFGTSLGFIWGGWIAELFQRLTGRKGAE